MGDSALSGERSRGGSVTTRARIIRVISENISGSRPINADLDSVKDGHGIRRDGLQTIAIQAHVTGEIDGAVTASREELDRRISADRAPANIECAVVTKSTHLHNVAVQLRAIQIHYPDCAIVP